MMQGLAEGAPCGKPDLMSAPDSPSPETIKVTTPDGLTIVARASGRPAGVSASERPPSFADALFIHGFSQSGLCWDAQTQSPALGAARMVAYDFRGHGASDKPCDPAYYQEPARWADEVEAVITQTGLEKPVLVGWSYAGRIIADYLVEKGADGISGIVFVDAATRNDRHFYGTCNKLMRLMCSDDLATNVEATRTFVRACFAAPPDQALFETLLAINMVVPTEVRAALFGRPADYDALLAGLDLPVLVVQGGRDVVVDPSMAHHIADTIPGARLLLLEEVGHAPFLEAVEAFNAALAGFLSEAARPRISARP